jgi:hypothetical protein
MRSPTAAFQVSVCGFGFTADLCRRIAFERRMKTVVVVILPECFQLSFQISGIPEEDIVKVFTANGSDQTID